MSGPKKDAGPAKTAKISGEDILREHPQQATVGCEVCLKEVPKSSAHPEEVKDYVLYFCGADCFDQWEHQDNMANNKKNNKH